MASRRDIKPLSANLQHFVGQLINVEFPYSKCRNEAEFLYKSRLF